jgi:hypothetical protein
MYMDSENLLNDNVITAVPTRNVCTLPPLTVATLGSEDVQVPSAVISRDCDGAWTRIARRLVVLPAGPGPRPDSSMNGYGRVGGRMTVRSEEKNCA